MIDPASLAFDIDGVVADTMRLFLDIARQEYEVSRIRYEDITCYSLNECLDLESGIIDAIITSIMDGTYKAPLEPVPGSIGVLKRIVHTGNPLLFVTARPYLGPIETWIQKALSVEPGKVDVVATGSFDAKASILRERRITHFVEDRLETCFLLKEVGITPVLFRQPWNRSRHPFIEVGSWKELESLILFP